MKYKKPITPALSTDGIIVNSNDEVLLIKRSYEPCIGSWILPGGHVEYGERVEEALRREVFEETGLKVNSCELLGVYSDPARDPRYHVVSSCFVVTDYSGNVQGNEESLEQKFFSLKDLPNNIGFDHGQMINDYKLWRAR